MIYKLYKALRLFCYVKIFFQILAGFIVFFLIELFRHKDLAYFIVFRSMKQVIFLFFIFDSLCHFLLLKCYLILCQQKGTYSAEEKVIQLQSEIVGNASKVIQIGLSQKQQY